MFSIDGVEYSGKVLLQDGLKRSFSVLDTDNSGRTIDGNMNRDIIGTYYNYTLEFEKDGMTNDEYDELYEILSAPVESHSFVLPYGQSELSFDGYITSGEDTLNVVDGVNDWQGLSVNVVCMKPIRRA